MAAARPSDRFSHSLTDLMAGIAAIFLVIAVIFMVRAQQSEKRALREKEAASKRAMLYENKIVSTRDAVERLFSTLSAELPKEIATVERDGAFGLEIEFTAATFEKGACALVDHPRSKRRSNVQQVADPVLRNVCQFALENDPTSLGMSAPSHNAPSAKLSITLEGHTDAVRAGTSARCGTAAIANREELARGVQAKTAEKLYNNVRLSGARAQEVFFALREAIGDAPPAPGGLGLAQCLDHLFVVSGRGPAATKDWETTVAEDSKQRKVVMKIQALPDFGGTSL